MIRVHTVEPVHHLSFQQQNVPGFGARKAGVRTGDRSGDGVLTLEARTGI